MIPLSDLFLRWRLVEIRDGPGTKRTLLILSHQHQLVFTIVMKLPIQSMWSLEP